MFVGIHATVAMLTKIPELAISEQEGKDFTKAAQNVMRHYSVQSTQKTLDWISFAGVAAGIYGTRAFAISMRKQQEAKSNGEPMGQVLRFRRPVRPAHAAPPQSAPTEFEQAPSQFYEPSVPMGDPDEMGEY